MSVLYTKRGDDGFSHIGKTKINKTDHYIEALGQLDELNCLIGISKAEQKEKSAKETLHQIQENLFIVQAIIAHKMLGIKSVTPQLGENALKSMETLIDKVESGLRVERKFIIPGTNKSSAWMDYIRAKSRTTERAVLRTHIKDLAVKAYLNRLSSLFFALAREEGQKTKSKEASPKY